MVMNTKKTTKRALLLSVLSLLLCISMLVGSTFAWFTDSVVSANNIIKSGNLDVVLEYKTNWNDTWTEVKPDTKLFSDEARYEPGYTEVVFLRVSNAGSLALKYQLKVNILSEKASTNVDGKEFKLSDFLRIGTYVQNEYSSGFNYADILMPSMFGSRANALKNVQQTAGLKEGMVISKDAPVEPGDQTAQVAVLVLNMPETVGNEANHKTGVDAPQINLGVTLTATQFTYESDSFDNQYDKDAFADYTPVSNQNELEIALANKEPKILLTKNIEVDKELNVAADTVINGAGFTISRAAGFIGTVFTAKSGVSLTLESVTVDGGAVWAGAVDPVLQRGTQNNGVTATGALVATEAKATVTLNKGAVLQNNAGANAVNLNTRVGCKLIINGGEIINNASDAGAIWGGGEIVMNSGKVNSNYGGIGGAIRVVTNVGTVLTMNGGEMNHNYSAGVGGAIWAGSSPSNNVYVLNGGEMAYNYSAEAGGAMYAGYYETVKIGGDFKMHDNSAPAAGAIRFHNHASFQMTGGEIYDNGENSLFLYNNTASITGGKITDSFGYGGGLGLTWGEAEVDGVITYNLSTNHNTAYLAEDFNTLKFAVNEADANFANFNFKPAAGYTYTAGDEAKLVCMNPGYSTYWDAVTSTFRLQAN